VGTNADQRGFSRADASATHPSRAAGASRRRLTQGEVVGEPGLPGTKILVVLSRQLDAVTPLQTSTSSMPRFTQGMFTGEHAARQGVRPATAMSQRLSNAVSRCIDSSGCFTAGAANRVPVRVQHETFGVRIVLIVSGFWTRPGYIQKVATREHAMPIQFRHDVDQVLKDAKGQRKPVLLDFSAAPM